MQVLPIQQNAIFTSTGTAGYVNEISAIGSDEALLMLQDPKAAVIFQKNQSDSKKAASGDPITALGYKLYNTFRYITNASYADETVNNKAQKEKFVTFA